ncbi:Protein of unknown function [Pyronema omphalodes CBS 100304]|uniref:Uncharacterized protein n=1 Tax=Pyronema omphalodes (strain CBS 100304) TaxID=1076935 RepID=U4LSH2_PYROM|nr:Protein of unknown function [Pyronema omphalodes CBS 100304]
MEVDEGGIRENSRRRPYRQPKSVTLIDWRILRQQSIRRLRIHPRGDPQSMLTALMFSLVPLVAYASEATDW